MTENVTDETARIVAMLEDVFVIAEEVGDERTALLRVGYLGLQFSKQTGYFGGNGTGGTATNQILLRTTERAQPVVEPVTTLRCGLEDQTRDHIGGAFISIHPVEQGFGESLGSQPNEMVLG